VKCHEFQECVCEIIDKRLSEDRTKELMEHATMCPHCLFEYESLKTAKSIVQSKMHRTSVPQDLYYSIVKATAHSPGFSRFKKLFGFSLNPVVAFIVLALVGVGIYTLFFPSSVNRDANFIDQSITNYEAAVGGSWRPQMVSNHDNVRTFLEKEVNFDVAIPNIKGCKSCGGKYSNFRGMKLAHVVLDVSGTIIYLYQTCFSETVKGDKIWLPEEAKEKLKKTEVYSQSLPHNATLVLWKHKNTLCAAVSKMDKDQLMALLHENE
jgi:hypothetical protein